MTEITDAEAREILWVSSDEGKAAVRAAWDRARQLGLDKPSGHDLDMADVGAILWAAHEAGEAERGAGPDGGTAPASGCAHSWTVLGAQEVPPLGIMFSKPLPRTAVLAACERCGVPETWLLDGAWTLEDLRGGAS